METTGWKIVENRSGPLMRLSEDCLDQRSQHHPILAVYGLPWHVSDRTVAQTFSNHGTVKLCQMYECPVNGRSRGVAYVEIDGADNALRAAATVKVVGQYPVRVRVLYYPPNMPRWDGVGRLPELPLSSNSGTTWVEVLQGEGEVVGGFGPEGYALRAPEVSLPNTCSAEGYVAVRSLQDAAKKRSRTPGG
eukprot:PhF_6_TR41014/c0_g1_i1/m.62123